MLNPCLVRRLHQVNARRLHAYTRQNQRKHCPLKPRPSRAGIKGCKMYLPQTLPKVSACLCFGFALTRSALRRSEQVRTPTLRLPRYFGQAEIYGLKIRICPPSTCGLPAATRWARVLHAYNTHAYIRYETHTHTNKRNSKRGHVGGYMAEF